MQQWHHDPEVLLRETGWLRGLAGSLITGKVVPEDISMHTMSATFRRVNREALVRNMSRFLRDLATRIERSESFFLEQPRQGRRVLSNELILDHAGVHRALVHNLLDEGEPCRSFLLLRYWDGLMPPEVARRLGQDEMVVIQSIGDGLKRIKAGIARQFGESDALWRLATIASPAAVWAFIWHQASGD
jgi:hypothetical protein